MTETPENTDRITVHVAKGWLAGSTGLMVLAGLCAILASLTSPEAPGVLLAIKQFNPDQEGNIFTWYNTALLLANGLLLLLAARLWRPTDGRISRAMTLLGGLFILLSLDEMVSIHERLGRDVSRIAIGEEIVYAWIFPGAVFVLVVAVYVLSAFRRLPRPVLGQMIVAGAIFVAGAIGVEAIGWATIVKNDGWTYGYVLLTWLEESFEITGLTVFFLAMVRAAAESGRAVRFAY